VYYSSRLNMVEAHLYGEERREEYIEKLIGLARKKKPS